MRRISLLTVAFALFGLGASAQTRQEPPSILIDSLAGRDSFELYCRPCHGSGGRGDGPVAAALRTRPADLTALARRNGGAFPREGVRGFITGTGRGVAAHGTTEMPIWGSLFRAFEPDARARERIGNLVAYIESMQVPSTGPNDRGSLLFKTHCASCHGADGRGNGPVADQLRHAPPDLTQYAAQNGGMFPRERVYRVIDGRGVQSHGDREMPIWGDVFKIGTSNPEVKGRIDAIVRYLEGIQERTANVMRPGARIGG